MIVQTHNDDVQNEGLFIFLSQSEQHCVEGKKQFFLIIFVFHVKKKQVEKNKLLF